MNEILQNLKYLLLTAVVMIIVYIIKLIKNDEL